MKKLMIIVILLLIMQVSASITYAKGFNDIFEGHWAYEYVNDLSDNGIINGYEDGSFRPNNNVSRAEFIKLITSADKGEEYFEYERQHSFALNWYDVYMNYALSSGFLTNEIGYGNPNDFITRKEMIIILGKVAKANHLIDYKKLTDAPFKDIKNVFEKDEIEFVNYSYSSELIKGYEDGTFQPAKNMTRAEVATVIYNFVKKVNQ